MTPEPDPELDEVEDCSAPKQRQRYVNGGRRRWKHCRPQR